MNNEVSVYYQFAHGIRADGEYYDTAQEALEAGRRYASWHKEQFGFELTLRVIKVTEQEVDPQSL